jgi:hypothetical protein
MDYTYPSVVFAYLFFTLMLGLAVFFFLKSFKDGYWGKDSEEVKRRMMEDD